jgi:tetratricopeptide (TPR) repeat protein
MISTLPTKLDALHVETELALGAHHYAAGNYAAADILYRRLLEFEPHNVTALLLSADTAIQLNTPMRAVASARLAIAAQPNNALAHFTLGRALHFSEAWAAAVESYKAAIRRQPGFALAYSNLAIALIELEEGDAAISAAKQAILLSPSLAEAHAALGRAYLQLCRLSDADAALRIAISLDPDDIVILNTLGRTLLLLGQPEGAISCHRRATELDPGNSSSWTGIGSVYSSLGRFDDAAIHYRHALEIAPDCGEAHRSLALCTKATIGDEHLAAMTTILADPGLPKADRISAGFALAKRLDDMGEYDSAFAEYLDANKLAREVAESHGIQHNAALLRSEVDNIINAFSNEFFDHAVRSKIDSDLPTFVVGLYRSGTTLTEQILASHPDIHGAGELFNVRHLAYDLIPDPYLAARLAEATLQTAAEAHLAFLKAKAVSARRIVDKHPDNIFTLGLIAQLFPNARVIICHRDPRDNVLSCYFQPFKEVMSFATDLRACAERYLETERLARHWRQVLPLKVLDVQYEALVDDPETQARRMIDFLDLEWHPGCLKFFETERVINTPSKWQVRQPIYRSSVGRWLHYAHHIEPLIQTLERERSAMTV